MANANARPLRRRGRPLSVASAAARGERELLVALRGRLADAIQDCHARDLAPLTRRLLEVSKELTDFDLRAAQAQESGSDESPWDASKI